MARTSGPGGEVTTSTQTFSCTGFADALDAATSETIGDVRAAIRSALNKMVSRLLTLVSSEIRNVYNVPAAILNDRLKVFSARIQNLEAELVIGGRSIPLSYFGMKASVGNTRMSVKVKNTERGPRGQLKSTVKKSFVESSISVEVIRGRRTTLAKSTFVAVMKSGHIGVMHRGSGTIKSRSASKGVKHRQQIYENAVVSIATMFNHVGVNDAVVAKIDAELEVLFIHELEFYTERSGR
jgi:hypothetical protein